MISEILAHAGQVPVDSYPKLIQVAAGADAGAHQESGRLQGAGAEHDTMRPDSRSLRTLVRNLNSGERRSFSSRPAALRFMGQIHEFPLLDSGLLAPDQRYEGALQARLDLDTLPAPLRLFAYFSEDWRLISEWYSWSL